MPKLILEFNLPEEREEAEITQKAGAYHSIIWDVQQYIRKLRKYDDRELIPKDELVDSLNELLIDFNE